MWIDHLLGSDGGSWYSFWSGAGADLGELAILGAAVGLYRRHNCHVKGCWRIGKQGVDGTSWVVCHRHHPAGHATPEKIAEAHERHVLKVSAQTARDARAVADQGAVTVEGTVSVEEVAGEPEDLDPR